MDIPDTVWADNRPTLNFRVLEYTPGRGACLYSLEGCVRWAWCLPIFPPGVGIFSLNIARYTTVTSQFRRYSFTKGTYHALGPYNCADSSHAVVPPSSCSVSAFLYFTT